jgi:FMN-dependent NADH-azoreductase
MRLSKPHEETTMRKTLLQVNASLYSNDGQTTKLADQFVAGWRRQNPGATTIVRDLAKEAVPHLTAERFQAFITPAAERSAEQRAVAANSDALIDELRRADAIVLGVPMYNFGVPSTLKAYFDHIARAGVTFKYTEKGAVGLLEGKKVYVFSARGGYYAGTAADTQSAYLRSFLRLLGITDVEFIYAEGLAMGDAPKQKGLAAAQQAVLRIVTQLNQPEAVAA